MKRVRTIPGRTVYTSVLSLVIRSVFEYSIGSVNGMVGLQVSRPVSVPTQSNIEWLLVTLSLKESLEFGHLSPSSAKVKSTVT